MAYHALVGRVLFLWQVFWTLPLVWSALTIAYGLVLIADDAFDDAQSGVTDGLGFALGIILLAYGSVGALVCVPSLGLAVLTGNLRRAAAVGLGLVPVVACWWWVGAWLVDRSGPMAVASIGCWAAGLAVLTARILFEPRLGDSETSVRPGLQSGATSTLDGRDRAELRPRAV